MSFVSIIAREKFINVVTDGQATRDGKSVEHRIKKFRMISSKQFIAYAGAKEVCENIANSIPFLDQPYNIKSLSKNLNNPIQEIPHQYRALFAIGGIGEDNKIQFYTLSNLKEISFQGYFPIDDKMSYAFLTNNNVDQDDHLTIKLQEYLRQTGVNTPNKCLKAQKLLNSYVETIDPTVNKITFELTIKL